MCVRRVHFGLLGQHGVNVVLVVLEELESGTGLV